MKMKFLKGKRAKNTLFAAIAVAAIIMLFALNLLLTYFGVKNTLFADMTSEGLYTLTDDMKKECSFIDEELDKDKKITVTFCADPDTLIKTTVTRLVYFMALEMDNEFDNLEVVTENVVYNPTSVSKYKPTSLTTINPTDVIVSYGDRYTVVSASSFWLAASGELWAFNGEYKMASLLMSVTAQNRPAVYFATGHGETYYDPDNRESEGSVKTAALHDLLLERGLSIKNIDLTVAKEIPEDCVLLIINNPTLDFVPDESKLNQFDYVSPLEVVDRYLVKNHGSVMVAKDYALTLPNFENFLCEWGFKFGTSLVKDETASLGGDGDKSTLVGNYNKDKNSYGYMLYGDFADLASSPSVVLSNTGYIECTYSGGTVITEDGADAINRSYEPFFLSSKDAKAYGKNSSSGEYVDIERKDRELHLAAISTRREMNFSTAEFKYSDVFCAASADFFSNEMLANSSYANYQIVSVLTENLVRTEEYASTQLGGISVNYDNVGGKQLVDTKLYSVVTEDNVDNGKLLLTTDSSVVITVLLILVAVSVGVIGLAVSVKRRYL
jgi:hypothetical protein